jgi:transposase
MTRTYAGIDSHKDSHTIVILNCFHEKLGEITIGSAPSEFNKFIKRVKKYLQPGTTWAFGFEDVTAYGRAFVKFLVERGHLVKHVEASKVATERGQVLNKTDSYDAECACRVLINQFDKLPDANPQDKFWTITNLVTRRNAIVKINVMVKNSLHGALADNYPHYKKFFSNIIRDSALAFYEVYPAPHHLENVTVEELAIFLKLASRGQLGEPKAKLILSMVERDEVPKTEYQDTQDFTVRSLIRQVKHNLEELSAIDKEIEKLLVYFDYPLTSIKGIDNLMCAKLIAEIGDVTRFKNAKALARYSGVAPVTYASGMTNLQMANARGNRKLNEMFFKIALTNITPLGKNSALVNPIFYHYFQKKLSEGKTKNQAIKCVQRRLVNIIFNVMKHQQPYSNPEMAYLQFDEIDTQAV